MAEPSDQDSLDTGNETDHGFSRSRTPVQPGTTSSTIRENVDEDDDDNSSLNMRHFSRDLDDDDDIDSLDYTPYPAAQSYNPRTLPPQTPAPWGHWTEDDLSSLKIRGPGFLDDKIKIPTGTPAYQLVWVDMFSMGKDRCPHVASRKESYAYLYHERRERRRKERYGEASVAPAVDAAHPAYLSPMIIINFLFPGPSGENMNLALYMTRRVRPAEQIIRLREKKAKRAAGASNGHGSGKSERAGSRNMRGGGAGSNSSSPQSSPYLPPRSAAKGPSPLSGSRQLGTSVSSTGSRLRVTEEKDDTAHLDDDADVCDQSIDLQRLAAFDRCMRAFLDGDDQTRDSRLKIIPRIAEGSWLVKKGVGTTPAILGRKVKQTYYRNSNKNYIEIDADVGSSVVAGKILSLVKSAATSLIIELSFLLQGESKDELPESLLTGVRIIHPSLADTVSYQDNWERTRDSMKFPF